MTFNRNKPAVLAALIGLVAAGFAWAASAAETYVGRSVDSRVVAAYAVPPEAAQAWLPEGWTLFTLPQGPLKGANLVIVLIDRHLALGPDGAPEDPATSRAAVLASYAVSPSAKAPRLFITRIYTTNPAENPYGVAVAAQISRYSTLAGPAEDPATRSEDWSIATEGGGIHMTYTHTPATPVWSEGESLNYSAKTPDFYRIYRYEQVDDLAMSVPAGKPLDGDYSLQVSVPELASMFDGTEKLIALISRPVYLRDTYLP